jgi:DNA gyrase subunit B
VEKARLERVFQNEEVGKMIAALGCGIGNEGFNLEKLRYHKIIIMTDADVDGSHIRTLLLTFFFRHMPALVENNFVYIAQPPLYRVTRKKTSRYIKSEKEMDDYLFELGLSDLKIKASKINKVLSTEESKHLLDTLLEVEAFINRIERKGITFREFMGSRNAAGKLPRFQINLTNKTQFVYSEDEFEALRLADEAEQLKRFNETLASIPAEEVTEQMRVFRPARLLFTELYEENTMNSLENELGKYGFTLEKYCSADGELLEVIEEGGKTNQFYTLGELVEYLRENGRKGLEIQRYKGLGEMNADQLWETTMDPEKRTLLRVTMTDLVAADYMFTMLMGDDVPPRRAFIEQHALSVKNLDV